MCISRSQPNALNSNGASEGAATFVTYILGLIGYWGWMMLLASPGMAQIVPDGSAGTVVNPVGNSISIEGGTVQGTNLFQSFSDFNVNVGQEVRFVPDASIENILSRVTGGNISNIDGLLGVDGNANLFLLNPNGVVFGPNASLDISGSFSVSTAGSLSFADGSEFQTVPQVGELFTASVPLGVQFNANNPPQGSITSTGLPGIGQDLVLLGNVLNLSGQFSAGGDLTLIGPVDTPELLNGDGALISLEAVGDVTTANLDSSLDSEFRSGGNIFIRSTAGDITTNDLDSRNPNLGGNSGEIRLVAAGNVVTGNLNSSTLLASSSSDNPSGNITITAMTGSINAGNLNAMNEIGIGGKITLSANSDISVGSLNPIPQPLPGQPSGARNSGNISITSMAGNIMAGQLNASTLVERSIGSDISLRANGDISLIGDLDSSTFLSSGSSRSGNISIVSETGSIDVTGNLNASNLSGGVGGAITLEADNDINLANLDTSSFNSTNSTNDGGSISVTAQNGSIQGASTARDGSAQRASISTFSISQGDSTTSGTGGNVNLTARDTISGLNILTLSSAGTSGNTTIQGTTRELNLQDLTLSSSAIVTTADGQTVNTQGLGQAGNTTITSLGNNISLNNVTIDSDSNVGGDTSGVITLENANVVTLNNTEIRTDAIDSNFSNDTPQNSSDNSIAGIIEFLNIDALVLLGTSSLISSATGVDSDGGNIEINTPFIVAVPNSNNDILVTAGGGAGGVIEIEANSVLGLNLTTEANTDALSGANNLLIDGINDINASSESGQDGDVEINTLDVDPSQGLTELPVNLADRSNQITPGCGIANTDSQNEFVITGRGGLPVGPNDPATASRINVPWVIPTDDRPTTVTSKSEPNAPLIEAQQIAIDANGIPYFVAHSSDINGNATTASGLPPTHSCAINSLS